jgi:hypothetical protein
MNEEFHQNNLNRYEGNGWSKYQLMVLQQLDDHNTVLRNLNKEIAEIKQSLAVSETEAKMWKTQVDQILKDFQHDVDGILYDEKGIGKRLSDIEREIDVEEQANTKNKATWALYGSIAMFVMNIIVQIATAYIKTKAN